MECVIIAIVLSGIPSHIVLVQDGVEGQIFVNGVAAVQSTSDISSPIQILNSDLVFGKDYRDNGGFYEGSMHNINFYSFALSSTQIQDIYSSYRGEYSVLLYYPFSDSSISSSGVANMATGSAVVDAYLQNSATVTNNQLVLSASGSQYMSINSFATGSDGLTFSCWFVSYDSGFWARLFEFGNGPDSDNVYISVNPDDQNILGLVVFVASMPCYFSLPKNFNDGTWYYIAWTLSPAGSWELYINGILSSTISQTSCSNNGYPAAITRQWNFLGKSNWVGDAYFNGSIWDFRVYNYVLSARAIEDLFSFKEPTAQPTFIPSETPTFQQTNDFMTVGIYNFTIPAGIYNVRVTAAGAS